MAVALDPTLQQVLITLCVFLTTLFIAKRRLLQKATSLPPGTRLPHCLPSVPILGSLPFMNNNPSEIHKFFMEQALKRGNVFGLYMGQRYVFRLVRYCFRGYTGRGTNTSHNVVLTFRW